MTSQSWMRQVISWDLFPEEDCSTAAENGKIIYLEHPAVWYTAEGGITALDVMLSDLEESL